MHLAELGERGLLADLARRGLAERIEDDTAVLRDGVVVTHDLLVEGVHFRREAMAWRDLGFKAAAVNLSDLAAAGAEPEGLLVGLALPADTAAGHIVELYEGLREPGVPVVGGDTSSAETIVLAVTAVGRSDRVPGRGGARPGDLLVVTGPLGGAGRAFREGGTARPPIRLEEGRRLAVHAHAMLDLSDGLGADAPRLAERSGCRLAIELEGVPLAEGAQLEDLAFGEDYELLAAVAEPEEFTVIGRCEEGEGVVFTFGGRPYELTGYAHFE